MKKARSEEEFKVLEQEVQHLREENVTLKDTILILKQQLAQERLAKEVQFGFNSEFPQIF